MTTTTQLIVPVANGSVDDALRAQDEVARVAGVCNIAAQAIREVAAAQELPNAVVTRMVADGIVETAARTVATNNRS